ncbi:Enamine deaminase RidA, house cleaning of reactive enamine intermediates, YjgF/YER057c/UK114 family [Celeribacter baekdonensis]|uniref:Enamine deaminase RidA, house cleaning of reactive enamine intermediates, YjgF/YER057c/UK114 family n=1 Tax=Celeribacter baekdonensis TaxID=875171 RepID=A0A1G7TY48_9RHOB|nr:Rid family hydrolase [Celeribacter baekdonensis]SDG40265.1 Enamine deaminase RidA, house cleaning of reactive enamine intermediates, YjgF/YER057c/UK114 family [Celeribacter baekdonensis]
MTKIVKVKTGAKLEQVSSYSRIVMVDNWISVSNTAGRNPETKEIPEDLREQTLQVFENIENALKAVGSGLEDVISTRVFIQTPSDTPAVMEIFGEKFRGVDPTTTVTCPPLGSSVYKVEIEVSAYRGASKAEIAYIDTSL